jgi:hypothetical protein
VADVTFSPRAAITLTFIAFGVLVGAQIGAIPVLKANAGVDAFTFGVLSGLSTAANILALALGDGSTGILTTAALSCSFCQLPLWHWRAACWSIRFSHLASPS